MTATQEFQPGQQDGPVVVRPVAGRIGADISGVDISRPLPPDQVAAIQDALYRYKVIFFRGQPLDHASHTDITAAVNPPAGSILRAEVAPEIGGDTQWTDNRATAHLAPSDIDHLDLRRTMYRITLVGDVPVGPDGQPSELVAGQPFTSQHTVVVAD